MSCVYILLFILCANVHFNVESKSSRKLLLTWEELVSCPNFVNADTDFSKASIYMANETAVGLKGTIELKTNLGTGPIAPLLYISRYVFRFFTENPFKVKSVVEKEMAGGTYMTMISYDIKDLCEKIRDPDNTWGKYLQSLRPKPESCSQIKNIYDVSGLEPESTDIELKKDMIGVYKVTIEMFRADETIPKRWLCYQLNFNIDMSS